MWPSGRRALRLAVEVALVLLVGTAAVHAVARPFDLYERLVKSWLPGFCDVIFFAFALVALRDCLRDDEDRSGLARFAAPVARWARSAPRIAEALGAAVVLVVVLLVSLALFDRGIAPLDEGLHLYGASGLLHGRQIYRDYVLVYPPGYFYLVAGIFSIFGESLYVMRIGSIIVQVALSVTLYLLVRRTSRSPLLALLAASLALSFGLCHGHFLTTAAWLAMLASLVALWAFSGSPRGCLIAGVLAALTTLFKQDNGAFLLVAFGVAAFFAVPRDGRSRALALARLLLPTAIAVAATTALLRAAGVSFADQWSCLAERPIRFATSSGYTLPVPGPLASPISYLPLVFYAGAAATLIAERRRGESLDPGVVAATVYGFLIHNGYWARADLWHLAYAIPPAFVAAPKAIEGARQLLERARRPLFSAAFVGTLLPIGFALYNLEKYPLAMARVAAFRRAWEPLQCDRARGIYADPYLRGQIDGAVWWIRQKCAPGDPFFVAPISPLLYFLADRPPAARFILISPEFGTSSEEQSQIVDDLERSQPKILLLNQLPMDGKYFRDYAREVYRACFEGRTPEHKIGEYLSFPGMRE